MDFKKIAAVIAIASALTLVVGFSALYASSAPPDNPHYSYTECVSCHSDQIDYHSDAASHAYSECISCHGDRTDEVSQYDAAHSQYFDGPHKLHLTSDLLSFNCTECHVSVDIREQDGASVRRQVSMVCADCHSPFPSKMDSSWASEDCTGCHSDWETKHAGTPYLNNSNINPGDCYGCHGGRAFYFSGAAALTLSRGAVYWASMADYEAALLSVDFSITNAGPGTANDAAITYVSVGNGVSAVTGLPLALGSIPQDSSSDFTLVYSVPTGAGSFMTTLYAQAINDDGETQYWPSPPPGS